MIGMSRALNKKAAHDRPVRDFLQDNYVIVSLYSTVSQAIQSIRKSASKDNILYVYVIDRDQKLCGVVSIRNLLLANDEDSVSAIYSPSVVSLSEDSTLMDAYTLFSKSRFLSLPVVNEHGKLAGIVPAHELADKYETELKQLFEERSRGELFELLGVQAESASETSIQTAKKRLPWIGVNITGGMMSAVVIELLSGNLAHSVEYLAFLPILLLVSESVGMQSASVVISNLYRTKGKGRIGRIVVKEAGIAFLVSALCGLIVGTAIYFWKGYSAVALTVGFALPVGAVLVSCLGTLIPTIFHVLRFDPRVAAGPVVLAISDTMVLFLYLTAAHLFN
jgi:magnesium transporter